MELLIEILDKKKKKKKKMHLWFVFIIFDTSGFCGSYSKLH